MEIDRHPDEAIVVTTTGEAVLARMEEAGGDSPLDFSRRVTMGPARYT